MRHWGLREEAAERVRNLPALAAVARVVPVRVEIQPLTNRVEVGLEVRFAAKPKELFGDLLRTVPQAIPFEAWPGMVETELARFALETNDWYARWIPYRAVLVEPSASPP